MTRGKVRVIDDSLLRWLTPVSIDTFELVLIANYLAGSETETYILDFNLVLTSAKLWE